MQRRRFLTTSLAAGLYAAATPQPLWSASSPNEMLRVAFVGVGGRGGAMA